jgi:tetratricopeptide (TPR) repeat protein
MAKETVENLCQKAQQAISQGKNDQARQFYQQALGLSSDNPDVHYGMATVCFLLDDLASSAYHFKEVTRLDPLRAGAYINLGAVFNRLEQYEEAIPLLRRGIQLDMNRAEGYYNLGLVYKRKGQLDMAIQAYREAVRVNPRMADAHYNIANIYLEKGQYAWAIAHYRQALEIRPKWEKARRGFEQAEAAFAEKGVEAQSAPAEEKPLEPAKALDPDRSVDPHFHATLLQALHRGTIDAHTQGSKFLEALEREVEPAIKELSSMLLTPTAGPAALDNCLTKFEQAIANFRSIDQALHSKLQKIRLVGEQLIKT